MEKLTKLRSFDRQ